MVRSCLGFTIAHELLRNPDFTFLQIGAYDGKLDDDLHELITTYRLRGVLVEPQADAFVRLKATYHNQTQVTLVNAAIAERECVRILYCPLGVAALAASLDRNHVLRHGVAPGDIAEQSVVCYTVEGVMDRTGLDHVDLLQIDAEGYDDLIIKSVDFSRIRPAIIRFEYRHLTAARADTCIEYLAQQGYQFLVEERDIVAWRKDYHQPVIYHQPVMSLWYDHCELTQEDLEDPLRSSKNRSGQLNCPDLYEKYVLSNRFGSLG